MAAPSLFFADLVRESSTAIGTGPFALAGALPGHRPFAGTVPVATLFHYAIAGVTDPGQWEAGTGRLLADGRLERVAVAASSDAGGPVNFTAGLKTVALTVGAGWFAGATTPPAISEVTGLQVALDGKQPAGSYALASHSHTIANVTGLQAALDGKMAVGASFAAGTVASPSVSFTGSTSSGLFVPATSTLAIATAGAERLRITSAGNVGIATTAPACRLQIAYTSTVPSLSASTGAGLSIIGSSTLRTDFGSYATSPFAGWVQASASGSAFPYWINPLGGEVGIGGVLHPLNDNALSCGKAAQRWSVIFAATGAISTSDARDKVDIGAIPDIWLDAWAAVDWQRYRFKGGKRWHVGLVAQRVEAAFAGFGIDAFSIGLLCRDPIGKDAGSARGRKDRWGLRYDECLALEAAWHRREIARLSARLAKRRMRKVAA
jgi:hypothetical protein